MYNSSKNNNIPSRVLFNVLDNYISSKYASIPQGDEDNERFKRLQDFLGLPELDKLQLGVDTTSKSASYDDSDDDSVVEDILREDSITDEVPDEVDDERDEVEKRKLEKKRHKDIHSGKEIANGFGKYIRRILMDSELLPAGFIAMEDFVKKLTNEFYPMAYSYYNRFIPIRLSEKIGKEFKTGISSEDINISPEDINKLISEAIVHIYENPDKLKNAIGSAFREELFDQEGEGEKSKQLRIGQVFFRPRVTEEVFSEMVKDPKEQSTERGSIDKSVLDTLRDYEGSTVKWKRKGIDGNKILHFTMPELFGPRKFNIKLPKGITPVPGEHTFKVKSVKGSGAVLEFVEQKAEIVENNLKAVKKTGLSEVEFKQLIYKIIESYDNKLKRESAESLIENHIGTIHIGDNAISSAADLQEAIEYGLPEYESLIKKTRGAEKVLKTYQISKEEFVGDYINKTVDRWGSNLGKYFLSLSRDSSNKISNLISSLYPEEADKDKPGIPTIINTRPVVKMVLDLIMDPNMPLTGGGGGNPWVRVAVHNLGKMALKNPLVRSMFEKRIKEIKKDKDYVVTDRDIAEDLKSASDLPKYFNNLKKDIRSKMEKELRSAPELRKFWERREAWKSYYNILKDDFLEEPEIKEELVKKMSAADIDETENPDKAKKFIDDFMLAEAKKRKLYYLYKDPEYYIKKANDTRLNKNLVSLAMSSFRRH